MRWTVFGAAWLCLFHLNGACSGDDDSADRGDAGCPESTSDADVVLHASGATLHGTLRVPAGCGSHPVALVIAGSGPTDRNGNGPTQGLRTDTYRLLADALADEGVASLRYDKRGVAASADASIDPGELRFSMYVDDAAAWLAWLKEDDRFRSTIVIGHSEGALIGILAGADSKAALVSLAGAGRPAGELLKEQLHAQGEGPLDEYDRIIDELAAGRQVRDIDRSDPLAAQLFDPSTQPYLISWFRYDPTKELSTYERPALIVQGTTDLQVSVADAELLADAKPDATPQIVDGMCHTLKLAPAGRDEQGAAYTDESLPLAPDLVAGLRDFLSELRD